MRTAVLVAIIVALSVVCGLLLAERRSPRRDLPVPDVVTAPAPTPVPQTPVPETPVPAIAQPEPEPEGPPPTKRHPRNNGAPVPGDGEQGTCPQRHLLKSEDVARCPNEGLVISLYAQRRRQRLRTSPDSTEKWTMVDVGSNKGYSVASTLEAVGVEGINEIIIADSVFAEWRRLFPNKPPSSLLCGACCDCGQRMVSAKEAYKPKVAALEGYQYRAPKLDVQYYAFDGQPANAEHLRGFFNKWKSTNADHIVTMTATHAAVTAKSGGTVKFPLKPFGDETASIKSQASEVVDVPRLSLDGFFPKDFDRRIDVLLTDTEGFDYFVLDGMERFVKPADGQQPARHQVGIYVFETQGRDRPLREVTERLEQSGYHCYFPVESRRKQKEKRWMVNITGSCWLDKYNRKGVGWKNVVCLDSADEDLRWVAEELVKLERPPQYCLVDATTRARLGGRHWDFFDTIGKRSPL